jgi:hypothetical protein
MSRRENLKRIVKALVERQFETSEGENTLVPLLVGPTQCGKTALVRELAQEMGWHLIVVLAQAEDPTELLGLGKVVEKDGVPRLTRLFPAWAEDIARNGKRFLVFLDEIDKAPADVFAGLLTLLRNRRIVNRALPNVAFVAAGNVFEDDWPPELKARFRVFPTDYDWEYEIRKHGYASFFADTIRDRLANQSLPPVQEAGDTPTVWYNLYQDLQILPFLEQEEQELLLASLFPHPALRQFVSERLLSYRLSIPLDVLKQAARARGIAERLRAGLLDPRVVRDNLVEAVAHLLREEASDEERDAGTYLFASTLLACLREIKDPAQLDNADDTALAAVADVLAERAPTAWANTKINPSILQSFYDDFAKEIERIADLQEGKK